MVAEKALELSLEQQPDFSERLHRFGRELCNFANLDPAFKQGRSDYNCIEATDTERTDPELPVDFDEEEYEGTDSVVPEATFTYKFEAMRHRYYDQIDNRSVEKAHLQFILSVIGVNKDVLVPEHLAEDIIGLPAKEAVREIGPVTLKATTMFSITPSLQQFNVCDHAEYLDMDNDPLHEAPCSCENNCLIYIADREVDDDGDILDLSESDIMQQPSLDLLEKSKNEIIIFNDIDATVIEWQKMVEVGDIIDTGVMQNRMTRAEFTLAIIQETLWTKVGFTKKQQASLRKRLKVM